MLKRLLCATALCVSSAAIPQATLAPNSTLYSDATPPLRFQGSAAAVVVMVNPSDIASFCGSTGDKRYVIVACSKIVNGTPIIAIPNPCIWDGERFGHLLCHEKGHVLGWPATHGD